MEYDGLETTEVTYETKTEEHEYDAIRSCD